MFKNVLVVVALVISGTIVGQTEVIEFDDFGRPAYVELSEKYILLELESEELVSVVMDSYVEFDHEEAPKRLSDVYYRFPVKVSTDVNSLLISLNNDAMVSTAARGGFDSFGGEVYFTNHFVIKLADGSNVDEISGVLAELGLIAVPGVAINNGVVVVEFQESLWSNYVELLSAGVSSPSIEYMVPTKLLEIELLYTPNDFFWASHQQYLHAAKQNLENAFEFNLADSVVIYLCDDGVADHEDWSQSSSIIGFDYTDWDSIYDIDTNYSWHGMAVAGVLNTQIDNDTGLAGYNNEMFRVRLHQISKQIGGSVAWVDLWVIAVAINDAVAAGADIINHSWGITTGCSFTDGSISSAFSNAWEQGVLSVAAAGNCNMPGCCIGFPANLPNVLTVGGLTNTGDRHSESSYGSTLDVMGYFQVTTLDQMGDDGPAKQSSGLAPCISDKSYNCPSGTSFAAPQAAAIAGLVLARRPDLRNQPDVLTEILRYSTDDGGPTCQVDLSFSYQLGYGRLDAFRALHAVSRGDMDNDAQVTIADISYLSDYMFTGGPVAVPDSMLADVNCTCSIDISDLVYLVDYMFTQGPAIPLCYKFPD